MWRRCRYAATRHAWGPPRRPTPPPWPPRGQRAPAADGSHQYADQPAATSWSSTPSPQRHARGSAHRCPTPSIQSAPSATAAARSANTAPGAYTHGPWYVSANAAVTCADNPVKSASSRNRPIPACETTPRPSADTFTRGAAAILFTCEVPSSQHYGTLDKSHHALRDRHFRLPTHPRYRVSRKIKVRPALTRSRATVPR